MIKIEVDDYERWAKEHELEPIKYTCPKCNKVFVTNQPFITKWSYGLSSEVHECGDRYTLKISIPKNPAINEILLERLSDIKASLRKQEQRYITVNNCNECPRRCLLPYGESGNMKTEGYLDRIHHLCPLPKTYEPTIHINEVTHEID